MNTPENQISFEGEKKTCSNIYEILAHPAVFGPLLICIFPDIDIKEFDGIYLGLKSPKTYFIRIEENLNKILEFFKNEENVKKFADEIEKFYLVHKEALDRAGINDSHKNAYSIAIATLRQFEDKEKVQFINKNISIELRQQNNGLMNKVQDKFEEILSQIHPGYEIVGDIEGNLINSRIDVADLFDFFGKKTVEIDRSYIDINTRKPVIIDGCEFRGSGGEFTLPNGDEVIMTRLKDKDSRLFNRFMISETEDYKLEGKSIFSLGQSDTLPNGEKVISVMVENGKGRYATKENKIYKVPFEGVECEVCNLWRGVINPEGKVFKHAMIIDKKGKKRQILITKHGIRRPKFTIFGHSFFKYNS